MVRASTIDDQVRTVAKDPLRILIVGGGIAGLTLARLLRERGLHPVVLERAEPDAAAGYMVALLPMVEPLLRELGLREAYAERSQGFQRYRIRGRHGQRLAEYQMQALLDVYGDYRGISRAKLLELLAFGDGTITYGATLGGIRQQHGRVEVDITTTSGTRQAEFDLVVVADGLRSRTRELLLDREHLEVFDAGWGGWVSWMPIDEEPGTGEELWGNDVFLGTYPVRDRFGIFLGGPRSISEPSATDFAAFARTRLGMPEGSARAARSERLNRALRATATASDCYYWQMVDTRAPRWAFDRVVLLGDAAAGFLPTAGIGAGMAMESAWVLAHHLESLCDGRDGDPVEMLRTYERAQRPRVEAAQANSRSLARLMFRGGTVYSAIRDLVTRLVPIRSALKPIRSLLEEQPDLDGTRQPE